MDTVVTPCVRYLQIFALFALSFGYLLTGCRTAPDSQLSPELSPDSELVQSCLLCHSTREMQRGPIIDGLPDWYVKAQLHKFVEGIRGKNPANRSEYLMGSGVSLIQSEEDLQALASYFSDLPVPDHVKTIRGDTERGAAIYERCVACHGPKGKGRADLKSPPLTVQEDWYLFDQMVRFGAGLRGGSESDPEGWLMHLSTQGMNTEDFRDVVSYINDRLANRSSP